MDEEALLIFSIGLCLGMVVIATQVGFSAELGAFIMGSVLAETTSAEKVEHLIKPVKDLFWRRVLRIGRDADRSPDHYAIQMAGADCDAADPVR